MASAKLQRSFIASYGGTPVSASWTACQNAIFAFSTTRSIQFETQPSLMLPQGARFNLPRRLTEHGCTAMRRLTSSKSAPYTVAVGPLMCAAAQGTPFFIFFLVNYTISESFPVQLFCSAH